MLRAAPALAALALLLAVPAHAADAPARGLEPQVERATKGERCVEDNATMRRQHMRMLEHQRDDTVHGGIRSGKHSLKGCIDCHAGAKTGSVAQAPSDFCVACHRYAAVKIDCFDCHSSKPAAALAGTAQGQAKP